MLRVSALLHKKGVRINNFMDGGAQERNRRGGTENLPYIAGLAKAITISVADLPSKADKLSRLRNELVGNAMDTIPHTRLNGSYDKRLPGNANFSFEFIEGESLLLMLDPWDSHAQWFCMYIRFAGSVTCFAYDRTAA